MSCPVFRIKSLKHCSFLSLAVAAVVVVEVEAESGGWRLGVVAAGRGVESEREGEKCGEVHGSWSSVGVLQLERLGTCVAVSSLRCHHTAARTPH